MTVAQRGHAPVAQGLLERLAAPAICAADTAYDSDRLRSFLISRGTLPVIPNNPARKRPQPFDKASTGTATSSSAPSAD
jgi:hypothetical protein